MVSFPEMASLKHIPFTYHWIVRRAIGDGVKSVLDLGCGEGSFMKDICQAEDWHITGVELFAGSVEKARKIGSYEKVIKADVTKLPENILNKKYDLVFSSQVLEHLDKTKGKQALKVWEELARKRIVVTTPVGFIEYDPIEEKSENNPLKKHLSGWKPQELIKLGFIVHGQGAKFIYGRTGLARKMPSILPFWSILALLVSPLTYLFPKLGLYMICVKEING